MENRKISIIMMAAAALAVGALSAPEARADDFAPPDWDRANEFAVTAEWDFLTDQDVNLSPDGPLSNVELKGSGSIDTNVTIGSTDGSHTYDSELDAWSFPVGGQMEFEMDNIIDFQPFKEMRVQITHSPVLPDGPRPEIVSVEAFDNETGNNVVAERQFIENFGDGLTLEQWRLEPNPDFETFTLEIPAETTISQVVVDSQSIPEPTSLGLLGLGAMALIRRRRSTQS